MKKFSKKAPYLDSLILAKDEDDQNKNFNIHCQIQYAQMKLKQLKYENSYIKQSECQRYLVPLSIKSKSNSNSNLFQINTPRTDDSSFDLQKKLKDATDKQTSLKLQQRKNQLFIRKVLGSSSNGYLQLTPQDVSKYKQNNLQLRESRLLNTDEVKLNSLKLKSLTFEEKFITSRVSMGQQILSEVKPYLKTILQHR